VSLPVPCLQIRNWEIGNIYYILLNGQPLQKGLFCKVAQLFYTLLLKKNCPIHWNFGSKIFKCKVKIFRLILSQITRDIKQAHSGKFKNSYHAYLKYRELNATSVLAARCILFSQHPRTYKYVPKYVQHIFMYNARLAHYR
jgi:hypothetical protein